MMTKDTQQNAFWWGKKHSASPHAFLPHPHAFCFVLFVIILVHSWDIKCCCPWATFFNTWKIPLEKTLGFFKHLKKCFMGCLVQVSQTPPPVEVSIKCTPQSNRYNTRCLLDIHLFRYNYVKVLYLIEITMYSLPDT